jgi:two-component system sensor histidine kinase RegB
VAAALLVAGVIAKIGRQLRAQEQALAKAREAALRQQQVMGLAVQAAGAAHRLSTPLATLTVLVDELLDSTPTPELTADLLTMQQQLSACRAELHRLRSDQESSASQPADQALRAVLDDWRVLRPQACTDLQVRGHGPAPLIVTPFAVRQALMNLLDNAANASPHWQALTLDWQEAQVVLTVEDQGLGFDGRTGQGRSNALGDDGLGMGVALAISAIEQAGGSIAWRIRPEGGTCVTVRLPTSPA